MALRFPEDDNALYLDPTPDDTPAELVWTDVDGHDSWRVSRPANGRWQLYDAEKEYRALWVDNEGITHVREFAIEGDSSIDAGTLDGLDSSQFARSDSDDTLNGTYNVTDALSVGGDDVLTVADEGSLDAGTLGGESLSSVRPTILDDGTSLETSPESIEFGQYLVGEATNGTVTIDSVGGNAVGSSHTASGDGSTTQFDLPHDLGAVPASADVTPQTFDAATTFRIAGLNDTHVVIEYDSAPSSGTDNLEWSVTVFGNDGSGRHAVGVEDDGTEVDLASTLDFGARLDVSNPADGEVTLDAAGISASDSGTETLAAISGLDFGSDLTVSSDGNEAVVDAVDQRASISSDGTTLTEAPTDINFANNLTVSEDSGAVTVNATDDADTVDGLDGSQLLRSDADDTHTGVLSLDTIAAANSTITLSDDLAPGAGGGLRHESGSAVHRLVARSDGLQALAGGSNLPTDYGVRLDADAVVAFTEPDDGAVAGWVDTNNESATLPGGVRVGDAGGTPTGGAALDVRGSAAFNGNQLVEAAIEVRSSDPADPAVGQVWIREDLL